MLTAFVGTNLLIQNLLRNVSVLLVVNEQYITFMDCMSV